MGNRTSVKPTAELDERKCDDITKKTGLTRDEIVQMHAEFLVITFRNNKHFFTSNQNFK